MNGEKEVFASVEAADFETSLTLTGYGKFHYMSILVCSLSVLMVGLQNGLPSYVLPAAQCELELSLFQISLLNVSFLIGGTTSCFLWGLLADTWGRRKVLMLAHLLNSAVTILCSTMPFIAALVVCRFLNGFFIGAPGSIIFSYMAEFQPARLRSRLICYCGLFFTFAWLLLPVMSYFVLPLPIRYELSILFLMTPWRLFMTCIALPEVIVGILIWKMPESPKFHLAKGHTDKTLAVLKQMFSMNTGKSGDLFPVKKILAEGQLNDNSTNVNIGCSGKKVRVFQKMISQIMILLKVPLAGITILTCTMMFCNMFGMFGLGIWIPELLVRLEKYQESNLNTTATIKQLSSFAIERIVTCEPSFDTSIIQSTIAMAVSSIIFNGICSWLSTHASAKLISQVAMLTGGIVPMCIIWNTSFSLYLIVACVFQATMITANMSIAGVGVEIFPTKVNAIAVCLIMFAGRLGAVLSNVVFGSLIDEHCEIAVVMTSVIVITGGLLCFFIPKKAIHKDVKITM